MQSAFITELIELVQIIISELKFRSISTILECVQLSII